MVREASRIVSNWRADPLTLDAYLAKHNIVGIEGVDTRSITRHIREGGAMNAVISTEESHTDEELIEQAKNSRHLSGADLVSEVLVEKAYTWNEAGALHVAVYDCGCKYGILRCLAQRGWRVTVVPASASADEVLATGADGVMLSNGPGDPAAVAYAIETTRGLLGKVPVFGTCLGHQMLGLALGGETYKLKFGHHGANHPVMDLATGRVLITTQNHGFCVDVDSLGGAENVEITHRNLNDQTCEGIRHKKLPAFSVQFHPEAAPGPHDARYLFDRFGEMMAEHRAGRGGV